MPVKIAGQQQRAATAPPADRYNPLHAHNIEVPHILGLADCERLRLIGFCSAEKSTGTLQQGFLRLAPARRKRRLAARWRQLSPELAEGARKLTRDRRTQTIILQTFFLYGCWLALCLQLVNCAK